MGERLPLPGDIRPPPLFEIELPTARRNSIQDVEATARRTVVESLAATVRPGMSVAVGAGSRGLTGRLELVAGTVAGVRDLGATPFVVPAMGSHGGADAGSQRALLASYGITEDRVGADIRSTMDVVQVGTTPDGMPVHLDREAAAADVIVPVNRVKPHTAFRGPVASGPAKMAVIGFGKQHGAATLHAYGGARMAERILSALAVLRAAGRIGGAVATVEDETGGIADVRALGPNDVGGPGEQEMLDLARSLLPSLPFAEIDVLVVEQLGKDLSGAGIDPNVTGRFWVHGVPDAETPAVANIVVLALSAGTHGNATGIGLADFTTEACARSIDWHSTWVNCLTAGTGGPRRAKLPMVLPTEDDAIVAALATCGRAPGETARMVRIASTLHVRRLQASEPLLAELPDGARVRR